MPIRFSKPGFSVMLRLVGIYKHLTLGARTVVTAEGKVLLVKHGYVAGWQFPGGGVDPGETAEQAARREVREETGYDVAGEMTLFGLYHSTYYTNRDHVALFIAQGVREGEAFSANREIAAMDWFDLDALPADLAPGVERRLQEISGAAPPSPNW